MHVRFHGARKVILAACCWFASSWMGATESFGQTFLEQLEAAVRQRLDNPPQPVEEELPVPSRRGNPSTDAGNLPSILESSPSRSEGGARVNPPSVSRPTDNAPPTGRIYLGLEAEEVPGGGIGVRVTSVTQDSPAWKAGFQSGDRIAAINGFAIANLDAMVEQLGRTEPGQSVRFLVSRAGRNIELVAVLMDARLAGSIAGGRPMAEAGSPAWLGVVVNDLTPSFRNQFGITIFRGAAVTSVIAGSPAAKAGVRAGDAIVEVSGRPIESAEDLLLWLSTTTPGQKVQVMYYRGSSAQSATMILEVNPENRIPRVNNRSPLSENLPLELSPPRFDESPIAPSRSSAAPSAVNSPRPVQELADPLPGGLPSPSAPPALGEPPAMGEIVRLQSEISQLSEELQQANQRLQAMQARLQEILDAMSTTP